METVQNNSDKIYISVYINCVHGGNWRLYWRKTNECLNKYHLQLQIHRKKFYFHLTPYK